MTNNPTIDGVSLEDERHAAVKALHDVMQSVPSASLYSLAEAVLDAGYAPAAERQEPALQIPEECPHLIVFDDADRENLMFSGAGAREAAMKTWEQISMSWNAHLFVRVERNSRDDRYPSATATSLPSTIARLEARVAELESGRGEPIYEQRYGGGWIKIGLEEYKRCLKDPEEASSLRIVFTAPPAPVAVADENLAYACELLHAWKCLYEDMRWNDASAFSSTEEFLGRLDAAAALSEADK